MLIVELTKDNEPREIPLSDYAVGWLQGVVQLMGWEQLHPKSSGVTVPFSRWRKVGCCIAKDMLLSFEIGLGFNKSKVNMRNVA